jgi:hypothetical protein
MVRRQGLECSGKSRSDLFTPDDVSGIRTIDAADERKVSFVGVIRVEPSVVEVLGLASRLANEVDAEVRDDAIEPREEAGTALEAREALVDAQERILDQLACVDLDADDMHSDRECT